MDRWIQYVSGNSAGGMHETGMNVVMEGGREADRIIQPTW